jgi:hypothetical protein
LPEVDPVCRYVDVVVLIGVRIVPVSEAERFAQDVTLPEARAKGIEAVGGPLDVESENGTIEDPAVETPVVEEPYQVKVLAVRTVVVVVGGRLLAWAVAAAATWPVGCEGQSVVCVALEKFQRPATDPVQLLCSSQIGRSSDPVFPVARSSVPCS